MQQSNSQAHVQPSRARAVNIGENDVTVVACGPPCGAHTHGLIADEPKSGSLVRNSIVSTGWRPGIGTTDVWIVCSLFST
jgi:hypothetical protein